MNGSVAPTGAAVQELVLVTGISGSGKSVALHALEDAGFYCVDNLPPELLQAFMQLQRPKTPQRLAIAMDVRSAGSLPALLPQIDSLRRQGVALTSLFLDAGTDTLVRRFSETRRPHPLANAALEAAPDTRHALVEAIEVERQLLGGLRDISTVIDTSLLRPAQLRQRVRELVQARRSALTLVFESFSYKQGVPLDADFVFDARVLPNPYYEPELRPLTGLDAPVAAHLAGHAEVGEMVAMIEQFVRRWLPGFEADQRGYLTVAVGCTGGQHRSVYLVQELARRFASRGATLSRHRELDRHRAP
jgi:RNase adapter protein RapZ